MAPRLAIIGVGNPGMGDDGIGVVLVERLRAQVQSGEWAPEGVELVSAGIDTLLAGAVMAEAPRTLVLDTAVMGAPAGEIRFFSPGEAEVGVRAWGGTVHSVPLSGILDLVRGLCPGQRLRIAAIQPSSLGPRDGLSRELESRVPEMLQKIKEEVSLLP